MSIVLGRVDHRLLHGIVAAQWTPKSGATRVMIIDDKVANNPMLKDAMKLGKPAGVALSIINEETAFTNFKNGKYEGQKVFVVCNDPQILLELITMGNKIGEIVIGGTEVPKNPESAIKIGTRVYIRQEEVPIYKKILEYGTTVRVQFAVADKPEFIKEYLD